MLDSIYLMTQKLILNLGILPYNHTYATLLWTSLHTKCSYFDFNAMALYHSQTQCHMINLG